VYHGSLLLHIAAIAVIGAAACSSEEPLNLELSREPLSSTQDAKSGTPPVVSGHELGPLVMAAPAPLISPEDLKARLADAQVTSKLHATGLQLAGIAGVSSPDRMYAVAAADHQDAETILSGANINDHAAVYVIVMSGGSFTALDHPPGVPPFQGTVLTATIEAATFRVTDVGIVNVEPDLSKIALGTVVLGTK
jgi:hypothetical protein